MSGTAQLGALIRRYRLDAGLSQEQLAERSGLSARAISDLERGLRERTRPETLRMLADALTLDEEERETLLQAANPELRHSPVIGNVSFAPEHLLPTPTSALIGREREVAAIAALLAGDARLVTLTGPGGVGKTRLAIESTRHVSAHFSDGVFFVDLSPVSDPKLVPGALAQALGVRDFGEEAISKKLALSLHDRRVLLVLDNFEQVIGAAPVVSDLLAVAPGLHVLVTSREILRVRGEREIPVHPLESTDTQDPGDLDLLMQSPAVQLFAEMAAHANPEFALDVDNTPVVAEICRRLDGLPLAIELAASRVRHFPPSMLIERMERRLPLLASGPRDLPARQRTLQDAITWSYDLLDAAEQALFRVLSVFAGSERLEAIEAVMGAMTHQPADVFDSLSSLVDKSMVIQTADFSGLPRFTMLDTIRDYARSKLDEAHELEAARKAHRQWFVQAAISVEGRFAGANADAAFEELKLDYPNMMAALNFSIDRGDADAARFIAGALRLYWYQFGLLHEGRSHLEVALALTGSSRPESTARALLALGHIAHYQGDSSRATEALEAARAIFEDVQEAWGIAEGTYLLGIIAEDCGKLDQAEAFFVDAVEYYKRTSDRLGIDWSLLHLGIIAEGSGDIDRAISFYADALAGPHENGNLSAVPAILEYLGRALVRKGDLAGAATNLERSYAFVTRHRLPEGVGRAISGLACLAGAVGMHAESARLLGAAENIRIRIGLRPFSEPESIDYDRALTESRSHLGEERFAEAWKTGLSRAPDACATDIQAVLDTARSYSIP